MSSVIQDGPFYVDGEVSGHPLSTKGMIEVRNGYGDVAYFQNYPGLDGELHARLFVAAPDLLAACKAALNVEKQIHPGDVTKGPHYRLIEILEAAIRKAEAQL